MRTLKYTGYDYPEGNTITLAEGSIVAYTLSSSLVDTSVYDTLVFTGKYSELSSTTICTIVCTTPDTNSLVIPFSAVDTEGFAPVRPEEQYYYKVTGYLGGVESLIYEGYWHIADDSGSDNYLTGTPSHSADTTSSLGQWDAQTSYNKDDDIFVLYQGILYVPTEDSKGLSPDTNPSYWRQISVSSFEDNSPLSIKLRSLGAAEPFTYPVTDSDYEMVIHNLDRWVIPLFLDEDGEEIDIWHSQPDKNTVIVNSSIAITGLLVLR